MSVEDQLRGFEQDAERGEKVLQTLGTELNDLNAKLSSEITELVRVMFTSDKQLERALVQRMESAAKENKEFIFTSSGQKFKIGDIDPKRVLGERELTSFEKNKLERVGEVLAEIERSAKVAVGTARRHQTLLKEFEKEAKAAANDLRKQARDIEMKAKTGQQQSEARASVADLENDIAEFEQRATRISAAEGALNDMQTQATKLMTSAERAGSLVKKVTNRSDLEDILNVAAGGFGISALIAALVGAMGTAGVLALPALVAFAVSRVVKIVNDIRGK